MDLVRRLVLFLEKSVSMVGDNSYLQALLALSVAIVFAMLANGLLALAKRWASKTRTQVDDLFLTGLHRPLFTTIILIGLGAATLLLDMHETAEYATVASLKTIFIFVWLRFALQIARFLCRAAADREGKLPLIQPSTLPLFDNVALVAAVAAGTFMVLKAWDVDLTAWVASAGIVGLAVSFAAKDTLANLFAGVFIIADAPYKVGDYVLLDSGERGRVTQIGLRSSRLLTRDDVEVTVPNLVMGNSKIVNESGGPNPKYRIRIPVGVCYGEDLGKARDALMEVTVGNEKVCRTPEPRVRFRRFGDWSIDAELLCWVDSPVLRGVVTDQLVVAIYDIFNREGITFPYPRRELYVRSMAAPGTRDE